MTEEEKIKYLYVYSESVDFDYEKTQKVCEMLELPQYTLYIRKYLKSLNLSKNALEEKVKEIKTKRSLTRKKYGRKLQKLNPVLLKHGKKSLYLWETTEDLKIVGKYIVDICLEHGNEKGQEILAEEFGTIPAKISKVMYEYYELIEKENPKEYQKILDRRQQRTIEIFHKPDYADYYSRGINAVLKEILEARKLSQIINIIEDSKFDFNELYHQIRIFSLYHDDPKKVNDYLTEKLNAYKEYKNKQQTEIRQSLKQESLDKQKDKMVEDAVY